MWRARATNARGGRLPPHLHPVGVGRIAARGSRPARSRPAPKCGGLVPELQTVSNGAVLPQALLPFRHSPGRGFGPPTSVATAGASRLAHSPLVPHRARQVSSSRRLGYEHPERTFSKATPTRTRPGLGCTLLRVHYFSTHFIPASVPLQCCLIYLLFLVCFTSQLCHRRFLKPVAGLFDFQPCAGYSSAPLPRPLSGAAGLTSRSALLFFSLSRTYAHVGEYWPARDSA